MQNLRTNIMNITQTNAGIFNYWEFLNVYLCFLPLSWAQLCLGMRHFVGITIVSVKNNRPTVRDEKRI